MEKIKDRIFLLVNILMTALFVPVFFCVIFVGNDMEYYEGLKLAVLLPNWVLFLIVSLGMGAVCFLFWMGKNRLSSKGNRTANLIFAVLFFILYFVNVRITREIAFKLPWDIMVVRNVACDFARGKNLGYFYYLSMYSNNIPIVYILGKLFKRAQEMADYPYIAEFIWMQVNCIWFSIGGYFSCLLVKKWTHRIGSAVLTFLLYLALVGISPWKMAPYTDTYGMVFPVVCIYFYLCFRDSKSSAVRYLYLTLSLLTGMLGGFIKPSMYLVVIAVAVVELVRIPAEDRKEWIYFLVGILLVIFLTVGQKECKNNIINEIGLDFNEEIEADWRHYFRMGLNEENTGSYHSADTTIFGEFQTSKSDRQRACIEGAMARLKERGVLGTIWFWMRKMTMTFNDGTFGWECEVWIDDYYPDLATDSSFTQLMRDIFWTNSRYTGRYNTFCQLAWIFCMTGFPGICLCRREKRAKYAIFPVVFLGIFLYQMLFEARARYLFAFLPLLIAVSVCGMWQYYSCAKASVMRYRRKQGCVSYFKLLIPRKFASEYSKIALYMKKLYRKKTRKTTKIKKSKKKG